MLFIVRKVLYKLNLNEYLGFLGFILEFMIFVKMLVVDFFF